MTEKQIATAVQKGLSKIALPFVIAECVILSFYYLLSGSTASKETLLGYMVIHVILVMLLLAMLIKNVLIELLIKNSE